MNLTIGNTTFNTWRQLGLQYFGAACGLTIAAIAAMAIGGWQSGDSTASAGSDRARPYLFLTRPAFSPQVVYYLTSSQEQAEWAWEAERQAANERAAANMPDPGYSVVVLTSSNPAEPVSIQKGIDSIAEEERSGVLYQLIDLRRP